MWVRERASKQASSLVCHCALYKKKDIIRKRRRGRRRRRRILLHWTDALWLSFDDIILLTSTRVLKGKK
jgi:hypothetical protein